MRIAGKGNLDYLSQLWQVRNGNLATGQTPSKVDKYKEFAMSKDELSTARTEVHQEKRKRTRMNARARTTSSLHSHKLEKARTGALTDGSMPERQAGTQNTASFTSAVPVQPLGKYRQVAQSDQTAEMASSIVVTG
ncbi:MAG: hypothetical protein ABSC55_14430 [Syntrophorhabdales bacterium]|jgi:hypothetical protein